MAAPLFLDFSTIKTMQEVPLFTSYANWLYLTDEAFELSLKWTNTIDELEKIVDTINNQPLELISKKVQNLNNAIEKDEIKLFLDELIAPVHSPQFLNSKDAELLMAKIEELEKLNRKTIGKSQLARNEYINTFKETIKSSTLTAKGADPLILDLQKLSAELVNCFPPDMQLPKIEELIKKEPELHLKGFLSEANLKDIQVPVSPPTPSPKPAFSRWFSGFSAFFVPHKKNKHLRQTPASSNKTQPINMITVWENISSQVTKIVEVLKGKTDTINRILAASTQSAPVETKVEQNSPGIPETSLRVPEVFKPEVDTPLDKQTRPSTLDNSSSPNKQIFIVNLPKETILVNELFNQEIELPQNDNFFPKTADPLQTDKPDLIVVNPAPFPLEQQPEVEPVDHQKIQAAIQAEFDKLIEEYSSDLAEKEWFMLSTVEINQQTECLTSELNELVQKVVEVYPDTALFMHMKKVLTESFAVKFEAKRTFAFEYKNECQFYLQIMQHDLWKKVLHDEPERLLTINFNRDAYYHIDRTINPRLQKLSLVSAEMTRLAADFSYISVHGTEQDFVHAADLLDKNSELNLKAVRTENNDIQIQLTQAQSPSSSLGLLQEEVDDRNSPFDEILVSLDSQMEKALLDSYRQHYWNIYFNGTCEEITQAKELVKQLNLFDAALFSDKPQNSPLKTPH